MLMLQIGIPLRGTCLRFHMTNLKEDGEQFIAPDIKMSSLLPNYEQTLNDDEDHVFDSLSNVWNDLSKEQKQKIMIIADLLPPEIEACRPSPPYRKNLCDWIILSSANYAGLGAINVTSLPPVMRDYIKHGICDARCFWECVSFYSNSSNKEVETSSE